MFMVRVASIAGDKYLHESSLGAAERLKDNVVKAILEELGPQCVECEVSDTSTSIEPKIKLGQRAKTMFLVELIEVDVSIVPLPSYNINDYIVRLF